jgi:hypothetical protein
MAKVAVSFNGAVFGLHVWLENEEMDLVFDGGKWVGEKSMDQWPLTLRMRFTAVPGTDWTIVAKRAGKKVLDEGDRSSDQVVEKRWTLSSQGADLVFDSEQGGAL